MAIMGPPSNTVAEEGIVETVEEVGAVKMVGEGGVQQMSHKGDNSRGPLNTSAIHVLPPDHSSEGEVQ